MNGCHFSKHENCIVIFRPSELQKGLVFVLLYTLLLISCAGENIHSETVTFESLKDVFSSEWKELSGMKIYFAHQSVGQNIVDGVRDLMREHPEIDLNLVETIDMSNLGAGFFAHSKIGINQDPRSKIAAFEKIVDETFGKEADVAALKFCYIDMGAGTNVQNIFTAYDALMKRLKKKHPGMTIIHFTEPLTAVRRTLKTWIKLILKKEYIWEYDDNVQRNHYNDMIIGKYRGKEPVFDMAKIQSTFPDGTRCTFKRNGKIYYSMVPQYTDDGAHLNEVGRKRVAEQLLIFLSKLT